MAAFDVGWQVAMVIELENIGGTGLSSGRCAIAGQCGGIKLPHGAGVFAFWSMALFLGVLTVGFIYEWKKGALEWE